MNGTTSPSRNWRALIALGLGLTLMPLAAMAADGDDASQKVGTQTRAWLDMQENGKAASPAPRPMPGEVADRVYQRYLKSFEQPLPEHFARESASTSGDSGGK